MKKLISLGIASAMVASISSVSFAATKPVDGSINDLKAYLISDDILSDIDLTSASDAKEIEIGNVEFGGRVRSNAIGLELEAGRKVTIVFGLSRTCPFAKHVTAAKKNEGQEIFAAHNTSAKMIKVGKPETTTNAAKVSTVPSREVKAGHANAIGVCAVVVTGENTSVNEKNNVYPITLKDAKDQERVINICVKAPGVQKDDTGHADVDVREGENYKPYKDGAVVYNGEVITVANLKAMKNAKTPYVITANSGVNVKFTVNQGIVDEGQVRFQSEAKQDPVLSERYGNDNKATIFRVSVPTFSQVKRTVNLPIEHALISKLLNEDLVDKITAGTVKKMYAYPIDSKGYDTLASAEGNDGVIDTEKVISVSISANDDNTYLVFDMPVGVTDVMVSTVEIDTTKLAAIPGVSIPTSATSEEAVNEIVAPVLGDATSEVVAPVIDTVATESSVVEAPAIKAPATSQPQLTEAPAGTTAQDTGASDVVTMAIALTAILVAAAAVRSRKAN